MAEEKGTETETRIRMMSKSTSTYDIPFNYYSMAQL